MLPSEGRLPSPDAPSINFSTGLDKVDIPELGPAIRGKVRDSWRIPGTSNRVMVTTDRQSAYDRMICTIPGKGQVLNLASAFWFDETADIVPNHLIVAPHPNVLIARQAAETLPVEVVLRRYMAKSATSTSVYHNYADLGRRQIYGIDFGDGLMPNQELPMGTIVTPTTKADHGHDEELSDEQAREIVDTKLGRRGVWDQAKEAALEIFERGRERALAAGLILVDTKYEFGLDENGELMLIDEVHTPDSSRFWKADTYLGRFESGQTPDTYDKEILRNWLKEQGFTGEGEVPVVDESIKEDMAAAYAVPYELITQRKLPVPTSNSEEVRAAVLAAI